MGPDAELAAGAEVMFHAELLWNVKRETMLIGLLDLLAVDFLPARGCQFTPSRTQARHAAARSDDLERHADLLGE